MRTTRRTTPLVITNDDSYVRPTHHLQFTIGGWKQNPIFSGSLDECIAYSDEYCNGDGTIVEDGALVVDYLNDEVITTTDNQSILNQVLDIIFVVSMVLATVAFGIATIIFDKGHLLGDLFCYWILIMTFAIIGLILNLRDTEQSEQYEEPSEYDHWDGDETDKINY